MKKTPLTSRCLMVAAVSALLPLTAAQADDRDYRSYDQGTSGAQGPMRSDSPTWSSESTQHEDSMRMQSQQDAYDRGMRGAEGPTRSELEAQGYTGDMSDRSMAACQNTSSEKFAPNAYYGESNPLISGSPDAKASFFGRGRWCD